MLHFELDPGQRTPSQTCSYARKVRRLGEG